MVPCPPIYLMHWWYLDGTPAFLLHSRTTYQSIEGRVKVYHQGFFKILDSLRQMLIKISLKAGCSLWLNPWATRLLCLRCPQLWENPWITRLLCLRCPEVSLIARRVCFSRMLKVDPLSTMTLVIYFSSMIPEINSGMLYSDIVTYFPL